MTASGRYASPDSSFGRSTGNAAARGGALIAVAVVIGFLLLWQGGVGGSDSAADITSSDDAGSDSSTDDASQDDNDDASTDEQTDGSDDGTDNADGSETDPADDTAATETTSTTAAPAVRPPGEVRAAVANGTTTSGLAGSRSGELATAGYVTAAVNAANNTAVSNVYYVDTYGNEAEAVAVLLGGDASVLRPATAEELASLVREDNQAQIDGYHILVVLGSDQVLG